MIETAAIQKPVRDRLSVDEIEEAISAFSPADWVRARKLAEIYAHNLPSMGGEDLLQEAITKFLTGDRRWPAGVKPLRVLDKVFRSIAHNEHKKFKNINPNVQIDSDDSRTDSGDTRENIEPSTNITPLDILVAKEQLDAVYGLATGDEEVELVVMAWSEGLRGKKAAEAGGFDSKNYDAARNRLIRKLAPLSKLRDAK